MVQTHTRTTQELAGLARQDGADKGTRIRTLVFLQARGLSGSKQQYGTSKATSAPLPGSSEF